MSRIVVERGGAEPDNDGLKLAVQRTGMTWNGREVAVIGLGLSNTALIRYLVRQGARVTGCDRLTAERLGPRYEQLRALGIRFQLGEGYLDDLDRFHMLFVTPGMRKDLPELVAARKKGVRISSETELFLSLCRARTIGITGSSGEDDDYDARR